ncbi:MAG: hypothetical protein FWH33_08150 [Oscillospiraceae bacterium]|nr:hypothetical protein [Oscillospiraceae bacterium]
MRLRLAFKTLLRSAARTALTVILLGAVAFALISQAIEHAIVRRETDNAAAQYCGVGAMEAEEPDTPLGAGVGYPFHLSLDSASTERYKLLTEAEVNEISRLPYVSSADARLMTAGISPKYRRLDDGDYFYNFSARSVIEGTLLTDVEISASGDAYLRIKEVKVLAGGEQARGMSETMQSAGGNSSFVLHRYGEQFEGMHMADVYVGTHRAMYVSLYGQDYGLSQLRNMKVGSRYAFVIRYMPLPLSEGYFYMLGDYLSDDWCDAVWPIDGEPAEYLEKEEYAPLREVIKITKADMRTFDVVYTEDMASIMRFAEGKMAVKEGRMLTREDGGGDVCVVSQLLASTYRLKIGDTLALDLGTELFEQYAGLGAVAGTPARYAPPTKAVELTIVGIYLDTDGRAERSRNPHWGYSVNTVFVPKTLYPGSAADIAGHNYAPGEFSFKADNAWDIGALMKEARTFADERGYSLMFNDGGWLDIERAFKDAERLLYIRIAIFVTADIAATALAVYLLIARRRGDYAIMRAMGARRGEAGRALLLPLLVAAALSVAAGGAAACAYTSRTVQSSNAMVVLENYAVDSTVPAAIVAACAAFQLLLALGLAAAMLRRLGSKRPLELLHGSGNAQMRKTAMGGSPAWGRAAPVLAPEGAAAAGRYDSAAFGNMESLRPAARQYYGAALLAHAARHVWRHMLRSAAKTALAVAAAILLLSAIALLAKVRESYAELVANTPIRANLIGELTLQDVRQIIYSGFVSGKYYEGNSKQVDIMFGDVEIGATTMSVTNDIDRFSGSDARTAYAEFYDASSMERFSRVLVVSKPFAEAYGVQLGTTAWVAPAGAFNEAAGERVRRHKEANPEDGRSDAELVEAFHDEISMDARSRAYTYTVVGIADTTLDGYSANVFTPGLADAEDIFYPMEGLEVSLADSDRVDEFRSYAKKQYGDGIDVVMNTAKVENLRNSRRLIEMLYPMAVAAALLIGAFMCSLMVLQSSREAAVMRVLGTGKPTVRAVLSAQQAAPCAVGLAAGLCCVAAFMGGGDTASGIASGLASELVSGQAALFAALYLAVALASSAACSGIATRRPPLELLQVRE